MPRRLSQEEQTRHQRTPLPPSMLDQIEAMVRHPTFQQLLLRWQSIISKNGVGLTEEEEQERNAAPRTRFQIAAWMEADDQWLSRSIQQIRKQGEAAWAAEAVKGPWGDDTNTIPPNRVPGDLSWDMLLPVLRRDFRQQQQQLGIVARQRPRQHKVDKWRVYDLRKLGLTLWAITHRIFKLKGKTTYDPVAQRQYAQVRRAHQAASALIHALDPKQKYMTDRYQGVRTHIASAGVDTSREPGLRHETGTSRSTVRQLVTRYSRKRRNQRPGA